MVGITQGRRPFRPEHPAVTDRLWEFIQRCWNHTPRLRPEAAEVLKELLVSLVPRSFRWSFLRCFDYISVCSNSPTWKLLFAHAPVDERIPLIMTIFSDRDEAEALKCLSGDEAQAFVDMIDEASIISAENGFIYSAGTPALYLLGVQNRHTGRPSKTCSHEVPAHFLWNLRPPSTPSESPADSALL